MNEYNNIGDITTSQWDIPYKFDVSIPSMSFGKNQEKSFGFTIPSMSFGQETPQIVSDLKMANDYDSKYLAPVRDNISDLQSRLESAERDNLTRSQKRILKKRLDANQALYDANLDSSALSKKQRRYLGDDSQVTQNLQEYKDKVANISNMVSVGADLLGSAFGQNNSMNGPGAQSAGVQAASTILQTGKDWISNTNPALKMAFKIEDTVKKWVGGTDGKTKIDVLADNIPGLGLVNAAFGKKANPLVKDTETLAYLGGGYDATEDDITEAAKKASKKYGVFSSKARRAANRQIADALSQQEIMGNIAYDTQQDRLTESSMTDILSNLQSFQSSGGWNQRSSYLVAKQGGKLFSDQAIANVRNVLKHQAGNKITKTRSLQELIDYAKQVNPRFIQRLSEPAKGITFIDDEGRQAQGSHYLMWSDSDDGNAIIYPRIQEIDGELQFLNGQDAYKRALENKNYLIMSPEEAKIFFAEDKEYGTAYKSGWPQFFQEWRKLKFQNGGKVNVIPDGALHARLHHLNIDGITKKGIPVVVQKRGGEVEQQAEVEKNEIIFNLDTTKKLEELWRDGSDEAAIEAGKLLVSEILENTVDNTGLLKEV